MLFASFTSVSSESALKTAETRPEGLTAAEVQKRLLRDGTNEITSKDAGAWQLFIRQLRSPFIYLLGGAALISFALQNITEGVFILVFVCINTLLGFSQEYHSAKALELLKQFVVATARVRREGHSTPIPSRELVQGDILLLEAGDVVPADARLIETQALTVDESILTGESVQAIKTADALKKPTEEAYEATNIVFSGTTIASGRGTAIVIATGSKTTLGAISHLTADTAHQSSFEKGLSRFSAFILKLVVVTLLAMFAAHLLIPGEETNALELVLFSIALAVSVIPEALPVVTTIALSKGALRLAKDKVVVKRLSAIEDLGSIEVLCTDKTGTITENHMRVSHIYGVQPEQILWYATLTSTCLGDTKQQANNSFDIALWQAVDKDKRERLKTVHCLAELPFDPMRKRNSALVQEGASAILIQRGAPEIVLESCLVASEQQVQAKAWAKQEGLQGRRVLAIATKAMGDAQSYTPTQEEHGFTLQGLIAFEDPIKESTYQAVKDAQALGVAMKILTGDSADVAGAVARTIGLITSDKEVMTGAEFAALSPTMQQEAVIAHHVFARVSPEQKHLVIQTLKERFEVGFLGEGINDAPALKAANIGIVVQGASDVAREAADVVLLQQSLEVIIGGIRQGREVFANTSKYVKATLASNFGNFYAVAISSFFIPTLPMLPLQILLLNLLSDFPMIAIATDTVDPQELQRPHSYQVREIIRYATILGLTSTLFDFLFFGIFYRFEPAVLQTNWFIGSILTELIFIYSIRTKLPFWRARRPAWTLVGLTATAGIVTLALPYSQIGKRIFEFQAPSHNHLLIILGVVAAYFVTTEAVKLGYERWMVGRKMVTA
ncbi:HAD-IC family P-type ATPase [Patescibacteria group bacterium]|nr:HAD-IC family P-type ATPase [Patescibacteria group bacterium]MBP9710635.1 HAD-IC family P-type ATPase [Patescibacteria group bacterium]